MSSSTLVDGGAAIVAGPPDGARYAAYFHALDAWTEYWDIYHPESRGRYYFGDGEVEGLLAHLIPQRHTPPVFDAWKRRALGQDGDHTFEQHAMAPAVVDAAVELDDLVERLFAEHFGPAGGDVIRRDYLAALHTFAIDALPPATERLGRIPDGDPRRRTAGRHTIDADMMWFVWAMQLEIAELAHGESARPRGGARRALLMAAIAAACPAQFVALGHRRTRPEYACDQATFDLLRSRAMVWSRSFSAATDEVHALYRIREWGHAGTR